MWHRLSQHFHIRSSEWFNAFLISAWGSYLILTPGMFVELGNSANGLISLAPQQVWGYVSLMVGMTRLCALFINGQWTITPIIRVVTSFMTMFVWFFVVVGLIRSHIPGMGIVIYTGLIVIDGYGAYRSAEDASQVSSMVKLKKELETNGGTSNVRAIKRSGVQ